MNFKKIILSAKFTYMKNYFSLKCLLLLCFISSVSFSQDTSWIENATSKLGLDSARAAYLYVADLNNDYYPDIILIEAAGVNKGHISFLMNKQKKGSSNPHERYFEDVTKWSNIDIRRNGEHGRIADVAAFADVDNDGDLDCISCIYYHRWEYYHPDSLDPGDRCEVLLNSGWGTFAIKPDSKLPDIGLTNATGMAFLDYDNNGNIDVFIPQWFKDYANNILMPSFLLKGNGDGSFDNVSLVSGIKDDVNPLYGANATDWNNDGWIDIATCPYCRSSGSLWKNNGNGKFTDVAPDVGYNTQVLNGEGWGDVAMTYPKALCTWAAQPQDFDNDGDIDFLYVLVHGGFVNDVYGKPAGHSTIVVNKGKDSNYKLGWDLNRLERKPPRSSHIGDYDAFWFDLDNDMLQDVAIGNGSYDNNTRLFIIQQDASHNFKDISKSIGIASLGTMYREAYSMEAIDFDLDGDDDILITHGDGVSSTKHQVEIIENTIGQDNNWIAILPKAPANVNRSAIGARIIVYSGGVAQMKEIKAGFGHFGGQQPFITNFGLASNTKVDSVVIRWPSNPISYTKVINPKIKDILIIDDKGIWGNVGIEPAISKTDFSLYPNPAYDRLNLRIIGNTASEINYEIIDISGKNLASGRFDGKGGNLFSMDISSFERGYYLLKIFTSAGETRVLPFMISR